jgi:Ni/Fe-hydrogenase subunit HybB-like protein
MDEMVREEILSKRPELPKLLLLVLLVLVGIGLVTFIVRIMGDNAKEAWQIYLINFIFWTGIAFGGIAFSCALRITSGRWGRPLLRISEGLASFVPVSFILLLLLLFIGKDHVLPYATRHYHHPKDVWLNISFVTARHVIGFLLLATLGLTYLYYSLRQDLGGLGDRLSGICSWIASGWKGEEERRECWDKLSKLAPAFAISYAAVLSLIAWDFMMSLDPHWFSTLFGPYYFIASLLAAMSATIILSTFVRKKLHLQDYITQFQYYDIGKLYLGFSMFWVYLMFSQFLAIWYANMPEETGFVIARVRVEPFKTLSWVVLSCCFFFPFISLIPRTNKVVAPILVFIVSVSFIGLWLEKFLLVTPSLTNEIHFGLPQILITASFLAGFILTFLLFLRTFPIMPVGDPLFSGKAGSHHPGGH